MGEKISEKILEHLLLFSPAIIILNWSDGEDERQIKKV